MGKREKNMEKEQPKYGSGRQIKEGKQESGEDERRESSGE